MVRGRGKEGPGHFLQRRQAQCPCGRLRRKTLPRREGTENIHLPNPYGGRRHGWMWERRPPPPVLIFQRSHQLEKELLSQAFSKAVWTGHDISGLVASG